MSQSVARPLTGRGEEKWLSGGFHRSVGYLKEWMEKVLSIGCLTYVNAYKN